MSDYEEVYSWSWCLDCEAPQPIPRTPRDITHPIGHRTRRLYREVPKVCGNQLTHLGHVVAKCTGISGHTWPTHHDSSRQVWWES
jgi:hypothetical protein